jgi:superfamily I DNA/RNA helicase
VAIHPINGIAYDLHSQLFGAPNVLKEDVVKGLIAAAAEANGGSAFSLRFLYGEWAEVVDPWHLRSWEQYRNVARLGRKTRIGGKQRESLWNVFERVRVELDKRKVLTRCDVFARLAEHFAGELGRPFDFVVVDEAQDVGVAELRFLAALGAVRADSLFFAGDLGQRIFQQPFSWKALGVDVRGRSHTLRINYRTSHQIRSCADRLLPQSISDVDGNVENRRGTVSVFNGPAPAVNIYDSPEAEIRAVGDWIAGRLKDGLAPHEIGVFVRAHPQRARAKSAVKLAGASIVELGEKVETAVGKVSVGTMHLAKGLEFRVVVVMACDDEVLPLQERIESVSDDSDLEEVYNTERHLLYVACTRARDQLLVTGVKPASEFLDDLGDTPRGK